MLLKLSDIADPPDVIADSILVFVFPVQFAAADFFTEIDRFQDRAIGVPPSADVVNFAGARRANEFGKRFHQIKAVNIIAHLFAFVSEYTIWPAGHGTDHKVGKKSVQLGSGMRGTG